MSDGTTKYHCPYDGRAYIGQRVTPAGATRTYARADAREVAAAGRHEQLHEDLVNIGQSLDVITWSELAR